MGSMLPKPIADRVDGLNSIFPGYDTKLDHNWRAEGKSEKEIGQDLTHCILMGSALTALGLSVGLPIAYVRRSYWPVVTAGVVGTVGDGFDGYDRRCKRQREAMRSISERKMKS